MRVALGFANRAALAWENLGFRIAEALLAARPGIRVERFFLPRTDLPLRSGEVRTEPSGLKLASTDLILFSLSYEGDAPYVPALLEAGGLPAPAGERRGRHPLVIAGGAAVMINPEPLAAFVDLFLVGEAEALLGPFLDRWEREREAPRGELVAGLAALPGALAPLLRRHTLWAPAGGPAGLQAGGEVSLRGASSPFAGLPEQAAATPVETIKWAGAAGEASHARLPAGGAFPESLLLELGRGCPRRCRFCVASRIYAPLRQRPVDLLQRAAAQASQPEETIGLLSLSAGDHPGLGALARELCAQGRRVTVSSLPATFADEQAIEALIASGTHTLTIAPETGSDRLRRLAGKPLQNEAILRSTALLGRMGLRQLRAYFIIGLPFEEDEDLRALTALLAQMRAALPRSTRLAAAVNAFVPKPRTPFQWAGMAPASRLHDAARRLARETPAGVTLKVKSVREALQHAALARGDAAWGARLLRMAREGRTLAQALRADGLRPEDLAGPIAPDSRLPWDLLSGSGEREALEREWQRALTESGQRP